MASGETTDSWYVRARGRVLGPLTWAQLLSLRDRGQLARFDEVSQDRQDWMGADRVPRLFPQAETSRSRRSLSDGVAEYIVMEDEHAASGTKTGRRAIEDDSDWYFARDGAQQGPVWLSKLQRMADAGEIGPTTLIWRDGLEQWTPGSQVQELSFPVRLDQISAARDDAHATPGVSVTLPPRQASGTIDLANPPNRTSILAINSLIMACLWLFGLGSLAAIVLAVMALRQIARSQGTLTGRRLAIAGMIAGIIGLTTALMVALAQGIPGNRLPDKPME